LGPVEGFPCLRRLPFPLLVPFLLEREKAKTIGSLCFPIEVT